MARSMASRLGLQADRGRKNILSMREKTAATVGTVVQAAEITGTAAAMAYMRHRMDDPATGRNEFQVLGIDPELLAGLGLHALSIFGLFGKWGDHLDNVADGALAAFIYPIAAAAGTQARQRRMGAATGRRLSTGARPMYLPSNVTPLSVAASMRAMRNRAA